MNRFWYILVLAFVLAGCNQNAPENFGELSIANKMDNVIDVHVSPSVHNSKKYDEHWVLNAHSSRISTVPVGGYFIEVTLNNETFMYCGATIKPMDVTFIDIQQ